MRHRLSPIAAADLFDIFIIGIEQFGIAQAALYREGIERTFDRLATFPAIAPHRSELGSDLRVATYKSHVIIYREGPDEVLIVRIRHAHEDWLWE